MNQDVIFHREFDPSLPDLIGDRDKLHQVFLNLIRNAVQASPAKGRISIRTSYCSQWMLASRNLDLHQEFYLVEIEDEGSGIDPIHEAHLFKPLFTTKSSGRGLGLSVSFRILSEHGGLLQYKRSKKGGAIFQVYVPREPLNVKTH